MPMRTLVRQPSRPVVRSGRIFVGTIIIRPSGRGTRLAPSCGRKCCAGGRSSRSRRRRCPDRRISSMAAGLAEIKLSGPASMVQPSTFSVWITPPRRGRDSRMVEASPALGQVIGGGEAGDAAADDDYARHQEDRSSLAASARRPRGKQAGASVQRTPALAQADRLRAAIISRRHGRGRIRDADVHTGPLRDRTPHRPELR